ncbi:MAG: hypothetical protein A2X80_10860 [Geobacteraceae bacterium GWB2_52_12]|nr:MAG: hypothetical protein A2X80_10860 [Geobacteraceae bacterium GWB2_52_12]
MAGCKAVLLKYTGGDDVGEIRLFYDVKGEHFKQLGCYRGTLCFASAGTAAGNYGLLFRRFVLTAAGSFTLVFFIKAVALLSLFAAAAGI